MTIIERVAHLANLYLNHKYGVSVWKQVCKPENLTPWIDNLISSILLSFAQAANISLLLLIAGVFIVFMIVAAM